MRVSCLHSGAERESGVNHVSHPWENTPSLVPLNLPFANLPFASLPFANLPLLEAIQTSSTNRTWVAGTVACGRVPDECAYRRRVAPGRCRHPVCRAAQCLRCER